MALGIILTIAALIGIFHGIAKKRKTLVIASVILLIFIATTMLYFYKNPY
ncbi:MAG: hypothetical protein ABFD18_01575 [Syntrophomonas sp.]